MIPLQLFMHGLLVCAVGWATKQGNPSRQLLHKQTMASPQLAVLSTVTPFADERSEVAAVRYDVNVLGTKGPRRMTAIVPAINADIVRPVRHAPSIHADNGIMDRQASCRSAATYCMTASVVSSLLCG